MIGGGAFFVDHPVAEEFFVGKVAVDVSGQLGVVIFAFFVDVAERFDRDAGSAQCHGITVPQDFRRR